MVGLKKIISTSTSAVIFTKITVNVMLYSWAVPPSLSQIVFIWLYLGEVYSASNSFGYDFAAGVPIGIILTVQNNGDKSLKRDFIIVDVLPDYLELKVPAITIRRTGCIWPSR